MQDHWEGWSLKAAWLLKSPELIGIQHRALGKRKTIVIVAEGAHDRQLNKISPNKVKDLLSNRLGLDTRITTLGHVQRGGTACAYDRMLSTLQGVEAVRAVLDASPEKPIPVICIIENKIVRKPLMDAVRLTQEVAKAISVKDFDRAMSFRGAEFAEYYKAYMTTTATDQPELRLPEDKVRSIRLPARTLRSNVPSKCESPLFMLEPLLAA